MNSRYNTKQKKVLIDYLINNKNRHLSAGVIAEGVKNEGIGKSTVYRQITELCNEGILRRFRGTNGKSVVYQYMDNGGECNNHFHLKCTNCGGLEHLDCESIIKLNRHIKEHHGFTVDIGTTIIYGICAKCSSAQIHSHTCNSEEF